MKPIITFLCAVLLTIASQVSGQNMSTSLTAVPLPGQPPYPIGSQVTINLNVTNFINVSSILLPVTYNSTLLRFDSIDNPVIPEYIDTTLVFHPNPGVIKISWFPSLLNYPDGVTVAGTNSRLLTLRFTVIGNGTAPVNLSTTVPFTPIEVINSNVNVIFNNNIFQSGGSGNNGTSIVCGVAPPPAPLVGFKIYSPDIYAKQGHRVCVPVHVNDFDSMIILQYAMHWDNTKLTYDCVRGAASPVVPTFNAPVLAPGTLLLQWEDPNLISGRGVDRADAAKIYEVCFNTIGAPGTETSVTYDGYGFGFPPNFNTQLVEATTANNINRWMTSGPNGPSGITSKVFIMTEPPSGTPLTYTASTNTVEPGMPTSVDVKVKNFTAITESEFLMTYDATKLSFVSPITLPPTALNLIASNVTHSVSGNTGTIKFKWSNAAGVTLADNTSIFSISFTASGAAGSIVPISFGTSACPNPTPYAALKKDAGPIPIGVPYKFENGQVTISASQVGPPTLTPTAALCSGGASGSIANVPNGAATSFVWAGPGINAGNINLEDPTGLTPGTYTVTITYTGGATATGTTMVSAPAAVGMTQTATAVNCFGNSDGAIDITPTGGTAPYTYAWVGPMGFTATTQDIVGVKTGNYVVTITDVNTCTFTSPAVNVPSPSAISVPFNGIVITTVTCFGGNNGAITIAPQGGTAPYTYDWSNDGAENPDNDPQNLVGLTVMAYTVTITDSHGCSFTPSSFTVSSNPALVTTFVKKENAKCFNSATGKAEITVVGGSGNKTFSWKRLSDNVEVSTVQNPTDLLPGTYYVVVTDNVGCTSVLPAPVTSVTIDNAPSAMTVSGTTTPGVCFGQANGSIDMTTNGGWGAYSFAWSDASFGNNSDINPVPPGTYTVTVTDNGGCTATQSVTVGGAPSAITIGTPVVSNVTCFGLGNGGICITPSGGNAGAYQVAWNGTSLSGSCIGGLPGGTYAPIVSDAMGCTATFASIPVTEPLAPLGLDTTVTPANPTGAIDLIVTGGTVNYTYQWTGQNGPIATTEDISGMPAGTYTVLVTDANGCSNTGIYSIPEFNANVFVPNPPVVSNVTHACNNDGCIYITIPDTAASGSPFTLSWPGGSLPASPLLNPSICGLAAGTYFVTVTASNGNTATVTAQINPLQPASYSTNTTNPNDDQSNGSITIIPTFSNYSYLWENGAMTATLSNLDSGLYMVTITNNTSGCTAVYQNHLERQYCTYYVSDTIIVQPTCASATNGSISLTPACGDGPNYLYKWSGPNSFSATTQQINNRGAGTYFVTVTDESGVQRVHGPFVLTPQSSLSITNVTENSTTTGGTQVSGANTCDGEATVLFGGQAGIVTILWSNGVTTPVNLTLCGGAYSVTVTDLQGCSSVWSDALTVPAAISSSNEATSPKCFEDRDGTAKVFVTGGIEPYEVMWSNGQFDQVVFSNTYSEAVSLEAGTYTVTITDVNDVTSTTTVIVPAPQPIEVSFTGIDPNSFNSCDGERIIFVTGAVEPIVYEWSTAYKSGDSNRAEGLCAGETLIYTITDANGCELVAIDSVPYPADGCFLVRPVLTPAEQDGNNDYTLITCIETVTHTVEIYNRWGQLVFQTDNYTNDVNDPDHTWTGNTRSGQSLPEGVYYYVLTYIDDNGNQHQVKGYINLLK